MSAAFPHLPAGREPGRQSLRNRSQRSYKWPFVVVVGTGMYAAGIWVAAGGRGDAFDRQEELVGGLFFAAIGLVCAYVGWAALKRGHPKRPPLLRGTTLAVGSDAIRRGDEVTVTVMRGQTGGKGLEVGLACDELYDVEVSVYAKPVTTTVRQTNEATVHEQWQSIPAGGGEQTVTFRVPTDAPYSYEGESLSYAWRASARAVRRWRRDARVDEPVWVEP